MNHTERPSVRTKLLGIVVLGLLLGTTGAWAQTQQVYGDIRIKAIEPARADTAHGYLAYQFMVTNRSASKSHTVELTFPDRSYRSSGVLRVRRLAEVAPGATVLMTLYQPPLRVDGDGVTVTVDGKKQDRPLDVSIQEHGKYPHSDRYYYSHREENVTDILLSPGLKRAYTFPSGASVQMVEWDLGMEVWPSHWLAYSCYDGVMISASDLNAMRPAARDALLQYAEAGGNLLVAGEWDPPRTWLRRSTLNPEPLGTYDAMLGTCYIMTREQVRVGSFGNFITEASGTRRRLGQYVSAEEAFREFPVIDRLQLPWLLLVFALFVFCLLIGPINMLVLRAKQKRVWLWWTVPAMSILMCGIVFGTSILAEGFRASMRTRTFVLLDQRSHRAVSSGWIGLYSPLTPSDGLHFSTDTEVAPQAVAESNRTPRVVDWSYDQHFVSGWVQPRVPTYFSYRKSESRRERLEVTRRGDGLVTVVNGLGVDVKTLHLVDKAGKLYIAREIPAGQRMELATVGALPRANTHAQMVRDVTGTVNPSRADVLIRSPRAYLREGTYIAELADDPFVDRPLKNTKRLESRAVVYGILE
jgi:hypothetical protein